MGIMDTLAGSRDPRMSLVGGLFGGQGPEDRLRNFAERDFPTIADIFDKATSEAEINRAMQIFSQKAMESGLSPQQMKDLVPHLVGPAMRNLGANEIGKLTSELRGQPAQVSPGRVGGPITEQGTPTLDTARAFTPETPGRNPTTADMFKLAEIGARYGTKLPEGFSSLVSAPSNIEHNQAQAAAQAASRQKTEQELQAGQAKETAIQSLPTSVGGGLTIPPQAMARINPSGLTQFVPQRAPDESQIEYQNKMLGLKEQGAQNAAGAANLRAQGAELRATQAGFNQAAELRKEFQAQSKNFQTIRDSYNRITTSAKSPTPAGDISMLFAYMKMLDPGSVVRESEFRAAATAKPLLERLGVSWDAVGSAWAGQKMTPGMRADFLNRASQLYSAENQQHQQRVNEYTRLGKSYGLNPSNIITNMEAAAPAEPAVPAAVSPTGGAAAPPKILKIERIP